MERKRVRVVFHKYKLLIKIPTRSRPNRFFDILDKYYSFLSGSVPYHFLITCDVDDSSMNNPEIRQRFSKYRHLSVYFGNSSSKIQAYNADVEKHDDFDILVVASDDMTPNVRNYDTIICDKMLQRFPDTDGVLNFHDGYVGGVLNTYPIIGKKYYQRFGYIYHPYYKSICCDNEFTLVSKGLNREAVFDNIVLLRHINPFNTLGKDFSFDDLYLYNESFDPYDRKIYFKRKDVNFSYDFKNQTIIRWSILISMAESNKKHFYGVRDKLTKQIIDNGLQNSVEVIFDCDNGDKTLGKRRNELLNKSHGEYICFIDDNEGVSDNFVKLIYEKLKFYPDCVGLSGFIVSEGKEPRIFGKSITSDSLSLLNPIRRDVAMRFTFSEESTGKDSDWITQVIGSKMLKNESKIEQPCLCINEVN